MSSKARQSKTHNPPKDGRGHFHRDHRVRRHSNYDRPFLKKIKQKVETLRINDLEDHVKTLQDEM